MEQDKADRLSDAVENRTLAKCQTYYNDALKSAIRKAAPILEQLKALENKQPPSVYSTPEKQDEWREGERRRIIRKSGLSNLIARELASAGFAAAEAIEQSMDDIDRINRVVDDIG